MRVALVAEWIDAWRGGAERSTSQFMHHLMQRGVDLHLFTRSRPSPTPGLRVHTVRSASLSRTRQTISFTHRVDAMLRAVMLNEKRFDVIHAITPSRQAHIYQPRGGTVAESIQRNIALRTNGAARTWKRHANRFNFKQRYMLALERRMMADDGTPVIVAISDYVVDQLRRHYDVPNHRIRKVFNGVDSVAVSPQERAADRSSLRRDFGISDDEFMVLVVAHNFRLKGVVHVMEALAILLQRGVDDVRVVVVGKGDSKAWHTRAARMNIEKRLTFAGPTDRMSCFRHAADALVHPTFYDPCSRVVLEAMCSGLPCVTTRWDGASELVVEGVNGFILDDPKDAGAIADRILRLRDRESGVRSGHENREVAARVSMSGHVDVMMALYEEVAGGVSIACR